MNLLSALFGLTLLGATSGHMVADPNTAEAGQKYLGNFKISHGCAGAATTEVLMTLPKDEGEADTWAITSVRPEHVPGWTIETTTRDISHLNLPKPHSDTTLTDTVDTIKWIAPVDAPVLDATYLYLRLIGTMPANYPGEDNLLTFNIVQTCEDVSLDPWVPTVELYTTAEESEDSDDDEPSTVAIVGLVIGALGLLAASYTTMALKDALQAGLPPKTDGDVKGAPVVNAV